MPSKYYSNLTSPGTLLGASKQIRQNKGTNKNIEQIFEDDPGLRQLYPVPRKNKKRNQRNAHSLFPLQVVHMDLVTFAKEKNTTAYHLALVAVCSYSRYVWMFKLLKKDESSMKQAMALLLADMKQFRFLPSQAHTHFFVDQGKEFLVLHKWLTGKGHSMSYSIGTMNKAFFAERFLRTLRQMLLVIQVHVGSSLYSKNGGWVFYYPNVIAIYNTTIHTSLNGGTPMQIIQLQSTPLQQYQMTRQKTLDDFMTSKELSTKQWNKFKNQYVRLVLGIPMFSKKSAVPRLGTEIFKVVSYRPMKGPGKKSILLKLWDLLDEPIEGFFMLDEIVLIPTWSRHHPKNSKFRPTISYVFKPHNNNNNNVFKVHLLGKSKMIHLPVTRPEAKAATTTVMKIAEKKRKKKVIL